MNLTFVEVCVVERLEPFVCAVYGTMNDDMWRDISKYLADPPTDFLHKVPNDAATIMCVATWIEGETQYGDGHGNVRYIPGCYELDVIRPLQYEMLLEADDES